MDSVIAELMARRGYAQQNTADERCDAWMTVVGKNIAKRTRAGNVRRGVFEVIVSNSIVMQELTFRKQELVGLLAKELPSENISDLRFRIGSIE